MAWNKYTSSESPVMYDSSGVVEGWVCAKSIITSRTLPRWPAPAEAGGRSSAGVETDCGSGSAAGELEGAEGALLDAAMV